MTYSRVMKVVLLEIKYVICSKTIFSVLKKQKRWTKREMVRKIYIKREMCIRDSFDYVNQLCLFFDFNICLNFLLNLLSIHFLLKTITVHLNYLFFKKYKNKHLGYFNMVNLLITTFKP